MMSLTARQLRERNYYDEYVRRTSPAGVTLAPVRGEERRPWNPYWYLAEVVSGAFRDPSQRLLDFGCGPGNYSVQFAHVGYDVYGFDISPKNIVTATALADKYGLSNRTHFAEGVAEALAYPDAYFDVIAGIDILHHVEIGDAIRECMRVLKPSGLAVFKEPIEAPLFDRFRNSRLGLAVKPKQPSFEGHITEDERKLTRDDLDLIGRLCRLEVKPFRVLARVDAIVGHRLQTSTGASWPEIVDRQLLQLVPPLATFAGAVVLTCRKP
jgi:SAM-dependent methyltransferase